MADGFRLPTEAEWQHAWRAGTTGARYGELDDTAWYRDNSNGTTHDVATKRPNGWGLFDMLGNVFEWCWDLYDPADYGEYRVLKGGGWADPPWSCRVGVRRRKQPVLRHRRCRLPRCTQRLVLNDRQRDPRRSP